MGYKCGKILKCVGMFPKHKHKMHPEFVRNGKTIAQGPSIAGFYGVYTGINEHYSLSYNVRENFKNNRTEAIWENLRLELDKEYTPL